MAANHLSGTGDPNGVTFGNPGDVYQDETGAFWLKVSGVNTNTGWVALSSDVAASNVLTFRPGSAETGPVVFDDFNALYAQFDALRTAAQNSGKFQIVFDDQSVGGPGNTVVLDSGPGNITYDFQYATLVGVHEDANVLLDIQGGGGEGDSLTIVNALWFEGLTIRATGQGTAFTAADDQTFTLTRTTFLGGGGEFVMDFLGVTGCILHLNDESTIERNGVFPAGQAAIRINASLVTVHMNGANCRVNANAFTTGGGAVLTPIVNSSSARFDFDQADAGGVANAQMSAATGYWTYGPPFTVTDPNGVLSATRSTLIVDEATGIIWRNTDGATAWTEHGGVVVQDEGTPIGTFTTLDFVGEGSIEAVDAGGGVAQVIVPGMACAVVDGAGLTSSARNCAVVRNILGNYSVTFTTPFGDIPGVGPAIADGAPGFIAVANITTNGFDVSTFDSAGVAADRAWTFVAIEGVTIT